MSPVVKCCFLELSASFTSSAIFGIWHLAVFLYSFNIIIYACLVEGKQFRQQTAHCKLLDLLDLLELQLELQNNNFFDQKILSCFIHK